MKFFKKSWPFLILVILALTIHLAFLSHPSQVVFDEVHFGKFVGGYFTGQYYFDIHPPLGKLMIAGFAKLAGVNPVFDFEKIGEPLPANTLFAMRFLPAFFGALFVLAFAWLAYLISRSKSAVLIAGVLILLDNAFLVQSRFILVDIFMLTFMALTFCFFFLYQRQKSFSTKWFGYLILTGLFFGLTISIKWTGLATIGIIGVVVLAKIFSKRLGDFLRQTEQVPSEGRRRKRGLEWVPENEGLVRSGTLNRIKETILAIIILLIIGFIVYLIPFYIHFNLLPHSGPGDAFMSQQFQNELKYGRQNNEQPLSFWQKFVELNQTMYKANAGITAQHPYGSRWYSWPIGSKPVYYWNDNQPNNPPGQEAKIYLAGNPITWWLFLGALAILAFKIFTKKGRRQIEPIFYILILGYLANLLPFILVSRVSFLYHYLPAALFGTMTLALLLARLWPKEKKLLIIILSLIAIGFLIMTPLSYGFVSPAFIVKIAKGTIMLLSQ